MKKSPSKKDSSSGIRSLICLLYCGKLTATIMEMYCCQRLTLRTEVPLSKDSETSKIIVEGSSFPTVPFPRDRSKNSVSVRPIAAHFEPTETRDTKPELKAGSMGGRILERKFY